VSLRSRIIAIALPFFALASVGAIVATASKTVAPVDISVVNVTQLGTTNLVAMEFRRCSSAGGKAIVLTFGQ
jgi:hypothetical protein